MRGEETRHACELELRAPFPSGPGAERSVAHLDQRVPGRRRDGHDVLAVQKDRVPAASGTDPQTPIIGGVERTEVVVVFSLDDK